ncbi:uncharacterized protein LOC110974905 isoform X2 [Acanthaster planci]|uniref:Uncharacterized protein LOC110974905 isoform X2 n=1 Tax=Acanthaster planci TaxID=133434 RepID=A0A8B7XP03_ACAPL|nr:uncharacterized protein LOC110974905 isoform X2 [Acanthaster planci]
MTEHLPGASGTMAHPDGFHILAELTSAESLTAPIKASGRIKYTCIAVSKNYIGLGASSGSLYIFHRSSFKYLQVFSNTEGALTRVTFAPDDNLVGLATSQGVVITWELNIERRTKSERLAVSSAHRNGVVTAMIWDTASERLFSGDSHGRVTFLNVYHRKMAGLFKLPTELVMDADSAIVQLDYCDDKLLTSTATKCFICDTKKKQAYVVGTKLRDGQFGACFLQKATKEFPLVYSARPSSRIWEGNIVGQVLATHQFKHLLAVPSLPVVGPGRTPVFPSADHIQKPQSLNFSQLLTFGHGHNLLLTWNAEAIYVFDPTHIKVILWSMDFKDILWACVYKSRVYCLHPNSQVRCYMLLSAERCVSKLYALSLWEQSAQVAVHFAERIKQGAARRYVPSSLVREVNYQLLDGQADLALMGKMEELLGIMEEDGLSTPGSSRRSSLESFEGTRLDSGIYLVRNRAASEDSVEDFSYQNLQPAVSVVDRETQMDGRIEGYDPKNNGKSDTNDEQDVAWESSEFPNYETTPLTTYEPSEMNYGIGKLSLRHSSQCDFEDNQAVPMPPNEGAQAERFGRTADVAESFGDFDEEVEVASGFHFAEDEEVEGPGELGNGPAGINWGFGQGRLGLRRQSSLMEEIAEKPSEGNTRALVKDGELDSSIAESLNSTSENPVTNLSTGPRMENLQDSPSTKADERKRAGSDPSSPGDSANPCKASSDDTSSNTSVSRPHGTTARDAVKMHNNASSQCSYSVATDTQSSEKCHSQNSMPSPSQPDHSGMGHAQDQQLTDSGRFTTDVSSEITQHDHSQMGHMVPSETHPTLLTPQQRPRLTHLPLESIAAARDLKDTDLKSAPLIEEAAGAQEDCPAIRRTMSLPMVDPMIGPDRDGRRARKQFYSAKDKKRSKKSRIIDFDKPQVSSKPDHPPKIDSISAVPVSPKAMPKLPVRSPVTSTPIKRSQSFSSQPASQLSPTPTPTKRSSQLDQGADSPQLNSFGSESMVGTGLFDPGEDMFWGGSSMMFTMTGPKLAAQFLGPSLSAVKESLSSKLVKTKTFLRQMSSEPEIGSPEKDLITTVTPAERQPLTTPEDPSPEPTAPHRRSRTDSLHNTLMPSASSEHRQLQSAVPRATSFDPPARSFDLVVNTEKEKLEYCKGLVDDAVRKLAQATFEAKQSLQDPKLSLSVNDCCDVLEKWLHVLQKALAPKNHHLQTESFEEIKGAMPMDRQPGTCGDEEKNPFVGEDGSVSSNQDLPYPKKEVGETDALTRDILNFSAPSRSRSRWQLSDPLGLPEKVLQDMSDLALLCFEMGVFGSDATPTNTTIQSDTERSGSFQGESSSPETDQSHPLLDPNMNTRYPRTFVTQSLIGQFPPNVQSVNRTSQSSTPSHGASQLNVTDSSSQGYVSMETDNTTMDEQDKRSANFVASFFFLLDVDRVRDVLKWREGWRIQTMASILDCMQASDSEDDYQIGGISRLAQVIKTEMQKGNCVNISHINRLLQQGETETALDVMVGAFPDLAPWEVMHLTQADTVPRGCFLDYATTLLESVEAMDRDSMLASICSDQEVICHLLSCALSQGAPGTADLFCACGNMPRPGSHMQEWQYGTLADEILSLPATCKDRLLNACIQHGFWQGALRLCLDLQQRQRALRVALQLADVKFFSDEAEGVLPQNMDEWILLLNLMSKSQSVSKSICCLSCSALLLTEQDGHWLMAPATAKPSSDNACDWSGQDPSSKPECDWGMDCKNAQQGIRLPSNWSPSVTWKRISTLLVKSMGPGLATRMLTDTSIPSGELSRDFYRNCILISMIEKHEGDACLGLLEGTDTYLWSKRNNTMAPPIYHQMIQERARMMSHDEADPELFVSKIPEPDAVSPHSYLFIEDHDCHWGTNVLLNSDCEICGHALSTSVSARTTGLLAFPCGHAFHSACVVEKTCVLCYEQKCQNLQ